MEHINQLFYLDQYTLYLNGEKLHYIFHTINNNTSNTIKCASE